MPRQFLEQPIQAGKITRAKIRGAILRAYLKSGIIIKGDPYMDIWNNITEEVYNTLCQD